MKKKHQLFYAGPANTFKGNRARPNTGMKAPVSAVREHIDPEEYWTVRPSKYGYNRSLRWDEVL